MSSKHSRVFLGIAAAVLLAVVCTSSVSAIDLQQVNYSDSLFWSTGNGAIYAFSFHNRLSPGDNNTADQDGEDKLYFPTVVIDANITYNVTGIAGNAVNITETISPVVIAYNYTLSTLPYVAIYDQSVSEDLFLQDFEYEVNGGPEMNGTYIVASHGISNVSIDNATRFLLWPSNQVNKVILYKNNNTVVAQAGSPQIINKFIVSSNITGPASAYPSREKVLRHGLFYTPLAFAAMGQNASFWMNMAANMSHITNFGLWASRGFSMGFGENETYTYHEGQEDEAFRWRTRFETGYPKVAGYEKTYFDTESGIMLSYETIQTRWDALIPENITTGSFYSNIRPQFLYIGLSYISIALPENATPVVPGYPVVALLVALGIGFVLVYRKFRK